jgi:signal transduction histidine kinase
VDEVIETKVGSGVEVGSTSARSQGGSAGTSVADTGVVIAPEDEEAVFEEFRQVGTLAKKVEGTGLGLALSRKFVELHGGRIWVESQVGVGSTFTFTIPVRARASLLAFRGSRLAAIGPTLSQAVRAPPTIGSRDPRSSRNR